MGKLCQQPRQLPGPCADGNGMLWGSGVGFGGGLRSTWGVTQRRSRGRERGVCGSLSPGRFGEAAGGSGRVPRQGAEEGLRPRPKTSRAST